MVFTDQLECTHVIAAHMRKCAQKDMLVTSVIGADDGQCHKNLIVAIIVRNKRFKKVVDCIETERLPIWKNFWRTMQLPPNLSISAVPRQKWIHGGV